MPAWRASWVVPRNRPLQCEVGFECRQVPLEPLEIGEESARKPVRSHELVEQSGCHDVGEHGASRADHLARIQHDAAGRVRVEVDGAHRCVEQDSSAGVAETAHQCIDQRAGTSDRDGETVLVAEHRQEPAVDRAAGTVRRKVRVQRVAREEDRPPVPGEVLFAEAPHRLQREPGQPQRLVHAESGE